MVHDGPLNVYESVKQNGRPRRSAYFYSLSPPPRTKRAGCRRWAQLNWRVHDPASTAKNNGVGKTGQDNILGRRRATSGSSAHTDGTSVAWCLSECPAWRVVRSWSCDSLSPGSLAKFAEALSQRSWVCLLKIPAGERVRVFVRSCASSPGKGA